MIVVVALTAAFASGVEPRRLILLAGAIYLPAVVGLLVAFHWFRSRSGYETEPSLFCEGVSSELRAGATLRDALTTSAASLGSLPATIDDSPGSSIAAVAAQVADAFPSIARELELTIVAAARAGSDAAGLFDEIGSLAIAQSEIRREIKVATAPGKATALVLLGAPVVYLVSQSASGRLASHLASSQQRLVAMVGLGLFLLGLSAACLVLWRAAR